jgi:hypothetical protein
MLRGLLGHASIEMTERYAHLATGQTAAFGHLLSAAAPSGTTESEAAPSGPEDRRIS